MAKNPIEIVFTLISLMVLEACLSSRQTLQVNVEDIQIPSVSLSFGNIESWAEQLQETFVSNGIPLSVEISPKQPTIFFEDKYVSSTAEKNVKRNLAEYIKKDVYWKNLESEFHGKYIPVRDLCEIIHLVFHVEAIVQDNKLILYPPKFLFVPISNVLSD